MPGAATRVAGERARQVVATRLKSMLLYHNNSPSRPRFAREL